MTRWIHHLSLATKLRLIIVYAAGAALLVASGLYITGEVLSLRQGLAQQLATLARSVAQDEASLNFSNRALAQTLLQSMRVDPNVRSVALFDASGRLFTSVSFRAQHAGPDEPMMLSVLHGLLSVVPLMFFTTMLVKFTDLLAGSKLQLEMLYASSVPPKTHVSAP